MRGNPALVDYLERLIRERGRLRFDVYMSEVLYHPDYGYYSTDADRIGARGDFYTAADLDPAMGQLLAGLFDHMAAEVDRFTLVEIGAGQGLLARHILEHRHFPYVIVERSTAMYRRTSRNREVSFPRGPERGGGRAPDDPRPRWRTCP